MRKAAFLPLLALVLAFCMIFCSCKGADEEADAPASDAHDRK